MHKFKACVLFALIGVGLTSCASFHSASQSRYQGMQARQEPYDPSNYTSRLPQSLSTNEKTILVDPNVHAWGAYSGGKLIKGGMATAGSNWCSDIGRSCRTSSGTFRIQSLGAESCKSHIFPLPRGGAPMPYCMFFHGGQGLHGSYEVVDGNVSHGCVRLHVSDAEWIRFNFANVGTKVVIRSY